MPNERNGVPPSRREFLGTALFAAGMAAFPRVVVSTASAAERAPKPRHPLDPLSIAELNAVVRILHEKKNLGESWRFVSAVVQEPEKAVLRAWKPGEPIPRRAFAVLIDTAQKSGFEAVVDLAAETVERLTPLPEGAQPAIMSDEFGECEEAVLKSPLVLDALKKRGLTDVSLIMVEPWSVGNYGNEPPGDKGKRLIWCVCFSRSEATDNGFARPVDGLIAIVDVYEMKVIRVEDYGVTPLPPEPANWARKFFENFRDGPKPLVISQPEGVSFTVDGWQVRWQNWSFRHAFTPREGLVLYDVRYRDGDEDRLILDRASICEMLVPYGDPGPQAYRKNAFDVGEYGLGTMVNSLEAGCDCLGSIRYFDASMLDSRGKVLTIKNAVCLHEEDAGLLWKHTDWRTNQSETRRSRRLTISFICTVGNYDYAFYWHFLQDGTIHCEVKLTGCVDTMTLPPGKSSEYGVLVAPQVNAAFHQHIFAARLDVSLDGGKNSVYEINMAGQPTGPQNPHGNAFRAEATLLDRESKAKRSVNAATARFWRVENRHRKNRLGQHAGYRLIPGENCPLFVQPDADIQRRAGFTRHHLWVTPFHANEQFPAGDYPNQHPGGEGLPKWTAADRPLADTDVVLWYIFAHNHVPRAEDWPVMPTSSIGFHLRPDGFFNRNPAIDLPPP